ncbi:MAG: DUF2971 domain-containing protein [Geobacter sp.]|nr:MAG: DUF2971 domain-containing protein [Geobacter sp.]
MWRKETQYKEFFYRYRHFDDDKCVKSIERLLSKNEMYLSSPLSFNDPYDCRPHYAFEATDREIKAYLKKLFRENEANATKNDVNRHVTKILNRVSRTNTDLETVFNRQYETFLQSVGMLCFSKSPENILLWSHYASSHTGICIQFESNVDTRSVFMLTQNVKYTKDFPIINLVKATDDEKLSKGLLTKADDWSYEQEYRLILPAQQKLVKYPDEALKSVIFGLKTTDHNKDLIKNWIAQRKVKPAIYQAVMKQGQYGLDFIEVEKGSTITK